MWTTEFMLWLQALMNNTPGLMCQIQLILWQIESWSGGNWSRENWSHDTELVACHAHSSLCVWHVCGLAANSPKIIYYSRKFRPLKFSSIYGIRLHKDKDQAHSCERHAWQNLHSWRFYLTTAYSSIPQCAICMITVSYVSHVSRALYQCFHEHWLTHTSTLIAVTPLVHVHMG